MNINGTEVYEMDAPAKKERRGINKYIPVAFWVFLALATASLIMLFVIRSNGDVAEFLNRTTGRVIRVSLTSVFNLLPFSFIETLVICSPLILFTVIAITVRCARRGAGSAWRFVCGLLCVAFLIFSLFVFGYESSYYGTTIEENTGIERSDLSPEELYSAADILLDRINEDIDKVDRLESGETVMPYTFSELNKKLNEAYAKFNEKYPAYQKMYSKLKPVLLSEPWTYLHTSGLYSFFTGEANINMNYPDFIIVSSSAHEMSHQRGIGKEDEADFASFLVTSLSDDPYIRYSGNLEIYRNILDRLYGADKDLWKKIREKEDPRIRSELTAFSVFFNQYRENVAATVSNAVNNAYIQSHNQPAGIKSYGLVVDLAVSYLLYSE